MIENRPEVLRTIISPFVERKTRGPSACPGSEWLATSFGMEEAGYSIRLAKPVRLIAGHMVKGLALERLSMPSHLRAKCEDKSTMLRLGVLTSGRAEPGWGGHLTLELFYLPEWGEYGSGPEFLDLPAGWGIAALEFVHLAVPAEYPPDGKYMGATEIQGALP